MTCVRLSVPACAFYSARVCGTLVIDPNNNPQVLTSRHLVEEITDRVNAITDHMKNVRQELQLTQVSENKERM